MEDANDNNNWLRKTTEGASKHRMEIYNVKKYKGRFVINNWLRFRKVLKYDNKDLADKKE